MTARPTSWWIMAEEELAPMWPRPPPQGILAPRSGDPEEHDPWAIGRKQRRLQKPRGQPFPSPWGWSGGAGVSRVRPQEGQTGGWVTLQGPGRFSAGGQRSGGRVPQTRGPGRWPGCAGSAWGWAWVPWRAGTRATTGSPGKGSSQFLGCDCSHGADFKPRHGVTRCGAGGTCTLGSTAPCRLRSHEMDRGGRGLGRWGLPSGFPTPVPGAAGWQLCPRGLCMAAQLLSPWRASSALQRPLSPHHDHRSHRTPPVGISDPPAGAAQMLREQNLCRVGETGGGGVTPRAEAAQREEVRTGHFRKAPSHPGCRSEPWTPSP